MAALTAAELSDARRYAGYPVSGAYAGLDPDVQASSTLLDQILAGLTADQLVTVRAALAYLRQLELDIFNSRTSLGTAAASVWKHDPAELANRIALFTQWRLWFCTILGIAPGTGIYLLAPLPGVGATTTNPLPPSVLVV